MCSFGFAFYGPALYLVALIDGHDWSIRQVTGAITLYYLLTALLTIYAGDIIHRFGPRVAMAFAICALALGLAFLGQAHSLVQLYLAFAVLSLGWALTNAAGINALVVPWFEIRRGLALSLAMTGASCGGVIVVPPLAALIARAGFSAAMLMVAALLLGLVLPLMFLLPRRATPAASPISNMAARRALLRSWRFWSLTLPFALGLLVQASLLTHLVVFLRPMLGYQGAAYGVSLTTFAAVVGRLLAGLIVDRVDLRVAFCCNFLIQVCGVSIFLSRPSLPGLYLGCLLFGAGVGNLTTLPGLIVQREFAAGNFARTISLTIGVGQFTFALGPAAVGWLANTTGGYNAALIACIALQATAAVIVLAGRPHPPSASKRSASV